MLALFPEIAVCAQSGDLEKLSILVRTYFASGDATKPRVNVLALVKEFGLPVGHAPIKYFGAIAVKDSLGDIRGSIIIRDTSTPQQQAFVLSHLLGHFLLHIQPLLARSEWTSSGFKEILDPVRRYAFGEGVAGVSAQNYATEDQADRFAGALLMPRAMLVRAMEKLQDSEKVAMFFGVTKEMVERRMDDIGVEHPVGAMLRAGARVATPVDVLNQLADSSLEEISVQPDQQLRDVTVPNAPMPRAVANNSYLDTLHAEPASKIPDVGREPLTGMARIRELARKMDKNGDKSKS
jgi:IrrE N-terminal-like domain